LHLEIEEKMLRLLFQYELVCPTRRYGRRIGDLRGVNLMTG
jgi:hypothetical protein